MYTHHHRQSSQPPTPQGPAWFYGYCHDSGQMRMMTYPEYVNNVQTSYSNLASGAPAIPIPPQYTVATQGATTSRHHRSGCGCHQHHHSDCDCDDCECDCHVHCADAVEYARCGEVRQIPLTFENDTRRDRDVALTLGAFATASGQEVGWQASLSDTSFTLPACGHKTVMLTVPVQCGDPAGEKNPIDARGANAIGRGGQVTSCTVAYATLRAEGCRVRPLVIAVAILPNHCGAHHADCGCGCC